MAIFSFSVEHLYDSEYIELPLNSLISSEHNS